jgi:histidine ammonia-lyase
VCHERVAAEQVVVDVGPVELDDVVRVARHGAGVRLGDGALAEIAASRKVVESLADDVQPHYGVSTGFGALATKHIPVELRAQLQRSLIRSHAAGSGPEVEREVVRALMLLRLSTLATGRTGVRVGDSCGVRRGARRRRHPRRARVRVAGVLRRPRTARARRAGPHGRGPGPGRCGDPATGRRGAAASRIEPVRAGREGGASLVNGTDGMLGMLVLALPTCAAADARPTSPPP